MSIDRHLHTMAGWDRYSSVLFGLLCAWLAIALVAVNNAASNTPINSNAMLNTPDDMLANQANIEHLDTQHPDEFSRAFSVNDLQRMRAALQTADTAAALVNRADYLCTAVKRGFHDVVQLLVANGARINTQCRALHIAVERRNTRVAQLLIIHGALIDAVDTRGRTALHIAAHVGVIHHVTQMIDARADVNRRDLLGDTALHIAARHGYHAVVRHLLKVGAQVDAVNFAGDTALHCAARCSSYAACVALLEHGAYPVPYNNAGQTPADLTNSTAIHAEITKFRVKGGVAPVEPQGAQPLRPHVETKGAGAPLEPREGLCFF